MTTASNAIKACIEDNWNPATGGTEPTVYTGAEDGMYPSTAEWVFLQTWEYNKRRKRRNDSFVREDDYVSLRVYTRNHADKEERLDEMVTEIYRIITPTNVTGYHKVDIIEQHRRASNKRQNMYAADLTVELKILSTSSTATPGSTTTSTAEFDELTVNTSIAGNPTAALGNTVITGTESVTGISTHTGGLASPTILKWSSGNEGGEIEFEGDGGAYPTSWIFDRFQNHLRFHYDGTTRFQIAATDSATLTQIEDLLMFGSANAAYVPMVLEGGSLHSEYECELAYIENIGVGEFKLDFKLPKPTVKGALKLYISNLMFGVLAADANDYIDYVAIFGVNGVTRTTLDFETTNHTSAGDKTFSGSTMPASAIDVSSYQSVYVYTLVQGNDAAGSRLTNFRMECYYAA